MLRKSPLGTGPLPCPDCGQITMIQVQKDCTLLDGVIVPKLDHWQCSSCKAAFFDDPAMDDIEAHRRKATHKNVGSLKKKKHATEVM
ncbi:MAG: hypothetical protein HQ568_05685 [Calditrichaeota bacterium]|nr:hypothetical protein [Calditrichota bacterium]